MPIFLNPRGRSTFGIGICARCSRKMFLEELYPDPNSPGLMVCKKDRDVLDPYRLPARQTERITLPFNRPDRPLNDLTLEPYFDAAVFLIADDGDFLCTVSGVDLVANLPIPEFAE